MKISLQTSRLAKLSRLVALTSALALAMPAMAQVPTGYQDFLVTGSEDQVWDLLRAIAQGEGQSTFDNGAGFLTAMNSVVSLTASADSQVVIYDHWEDGYEVNPILPVQSTTLVLGDANNANGRACDFTTDPAVTCGGANPDRLFKGTELTLNSDGGLPTCGAAPCIARQPNPVRVGACSSGVPASPADRRCSVPLPRNAAHIRFDGADRMLTSGGPISLVHSQDPMSPYIGGACEIIPKEAVENAVSYTIPIGRDLYAGNNTPTEALKYVYLELVAYDANTLVTIESPGAGVVNFTLNQGQHYSSRGFIDATSVPSIALVINAGTKVSTSAPIAGMMVTGGDGNFANRMDLLLPDVLHGTDYITIAPGDDPAVNGNRPLNLFIVNPDQFNAITVTATDTTGTTNINIAAGQAVNYQAAAGRAVPNGSTVRLTSNRNFWGTSVYDSQDFQDDWGHSWIATKFLEETYTVSFSPGCTNPAAATLPAARLANDADCTIPPAAQNVCDTLNRAPVFVAATQNNTRVRIDLNADGVYDVVDVNSDDVPDPANTTPTPTPLGWVVGPDATTYVVNQLRALRIYDYTDYDNTGTLIVADKPVAMAWGEDTDQATGPDAVPDTGYTVFQATLDAVLKLDKTVTPVTVPTSGGLVTYTLVIESGDVGDLTVVSVSDLLPTGIPCSAFVSGSSLITYPNFTQSTADPTCGPDPGGSGRNLMTWAFSPDDLDRNLRITVSYRMNIPAGPVGVLINEAEASGTLNGSQFRPSDQAEVTRTDASIAKSVTISSPGIAEPGAILTYTLQVRNNGVAAETNVVILDAIPANTTFVPGSIVVAGPFAGTFLAGSNSVQYTAASFAAGSGPFNLTFQAQINPTANAGDIITNHAIYSSTQTPFLLSNTVETPISAPAITTTKSGPAGPLHPGETVDWEIVVQNTGSGTAHNVVVVDPVATNSTYVAGSMSWRRNALPFSNLTDANDADEGRLLAAPARTQLTIGTLGPGAQATFRFRVTVNAGTGGQFLPNQATVTSTEVDPTDTNLISLPILTGTTANLTGRVYLDIDGNAAQGGAEPGIANVTVVLTYTSSGGPVEIEVVTDANGNWALPFAIQPGIAVTINVDGADPDIPNGAVLTTANDPQVTPGLAAGANTSSHVGYQPPPLSITKTSNAGGTVSPGQVITYTLNVANYSGITQNNISVIDPLPAGTSYVPGSGAITRHTPERRPFRTREYVITTANFPDATMNLTLDNTLQQNYFVLIQGSADADTNDPAADYAALTADPWGTGDLVPSGATNRLTFTRGSNGDDWRGVITVVECLEDCTSRGFRLLDVQQVAHTAAGTSGTDTSSVAWNASRVFLMTGHKGAGCFTASTSGNAHPACQVRVFPSGTTTINWTRGGGGGGALAVATSTVAVLEWGTEWTVQNVQVTGGNGGGDADAVGEYNAAAISSVVRADTWVWGHGHTDDNGAGDGGDGFLITLGTGTSTAASEASVAVGLGLAQTGKNVQVWAMTHTNLAVDYRKEVNGDGADLTQDTTVNAATDSTARFTMAWNGLNTSDSTDAYPQVLATGRYTANTTTQMTRAVGGNDFPAWVQGIDFSPFVIAPSSVSLGATGAPPNLILLPSQNIDLLNRQTLTITYQVTVSPTISDAIPAINNTATLDSDELVTPVNDSVSDNVVHLGLVVEYNNAGFAQANFASPQVLLFSHDVVNTGNATDSYTLVVASERGWKVELIDPLTGAILAVDNTGNGTWDVGGPINTGPLAPGDRVQYDVRVTVPALTALGVQETVRLIGTSDANPGLSDFSTDEIELVHVSDIGPVVILPDNSGVVGIDGNLAYAHYVFNNTGGPATFNLQVTNVMDGNANPPGWSATLYGDTNFDGVYTPTVDLPISNSANLANGASQLFFVVVDSPPSALPGDTVVSVLTATQVGFPNVTTGASDTTTVVLPASHDLAGGGTRLVQGGDVAIFPGTVFNQGSLSDTFELSVSPSAFFGFDPYLHPTELWVDTNADGTPDTLLASDTDGDGDWDFLLGGVGGVNDPDADGLPQVVVAGGAQRAYELRRAVNINQTTYRDIVTLTAVSANSGDQDSISAINLLATATDAVLASLEAHKSGGRVALSWSTAAEIGTVGFDVFRRAEGSPTWHKVGDTVPGLLHAPQGGRYRFVDSAPLAGEVYYQLVERVVDGGKRFLGQPLLIDTRRLPAEDALQAARPDVDAIAHAGDPDRRRGVEPRPERTAGGAPAAVRVYTRGDGLVRLTAAQLAAAFDRPASEVQTAITTGQLALSRRDVAVSWLRDGDDLLFVARTPENIYSNDDVVVARFGAGLVMPAPVGGSLLFADDFETGDTSRWGQSASPAPLPVGTAITVLRALAAGEQNLLPVTATATDPDGDFWHWQSFFAGGAAKTLAVFTPAPALDAQATLRVYFQGFTSTTAPIDHRAKVRVGGSDLGVASWDGATALTASFPLPANLVGEGVTNVEIVPELPAGVDFAVFYVDRIEIDYSRRRELVAGRLDAVQPGFGTLELAGLQNQTLAFDLGHPDQPRRLLIGAGLVDLPHGVSRLLVQNAGSAAAPHALAPDYPSNLRDTSRRASYLVIAGAGLEEPAAQLAALRAATGYETAVVEIEDVYDEFGGGAVDAMALQRFLAYAATSWSLKPTHVALMGDGSFDYRDTFGAGENLVLSPMTATAHGLVPSDQRLADTTGDGMPDLAIGRLPFRFADQADAYLAQLGSRANAAGAWTSAALWVADDPDHGGEFPVDLDALIAAAPAGWSGEEVDRSRLAIDPARAALINAFSDGAAFVTYLGHGGFDRLANEGLLRSSDVGNLSNDTRRPVLAAMTCNVGRSDFPGMETLTEELLLGDGGGAIAVISPTGLQLNADGLDLARRFFGTGPGRTLGDALLRSLRAWVAAGGDPAVARTYALAGDPAMPFAPGSQP